RRELDRGSGATTPLWPGDARRVAQSSVDRAGLELRGEDAGGPVLAERARSPHRGGGFDSVRRGERGPDAALDHLLVAASPGRGEPAREVSAALPATMAGAAVSGVRDSGFGVHSRAPSPEARIPTAPRPPCRRSGGTWRRPCLPRSRPAPRS